MTADEVKTFIEQELTKLNCTGGNPIQVSQQTPDGTQKPCVILTESSYDRMYDLIQQQLIQKDLLEDISSREPWIVAQKGRIPIFMVRQP